MPTGNVYSKATVVKSDNGKEENNSEIQDYKLGSFVGGKVNNANEEQTQQMKDIATLSNRAMHSSSDPLIDEIKNLSASVNEIRQKVSNIENNGVAGRDLDKQVVAAIKDLKHYASFFEQATFQMETKILKTSMSIAKKIINIEIGQSSTAIAKETIANLLLKIKTASKVTIHLNPKDYAVLKNELELEPYIVLQEDANVTAGGVVIASDLGNFDGNIEAKINTMMESLDLVL